MSVEEPSPTLGLMTFHSSASTRVRFIAAAAVALLALLALPASAKSRYEPVNGRWVGAVPCVMTSLDPATGHTTCTGSTTWVGTWTGVTHYTLDGTYDPVTGAAEATLDETFVGRDEHGRIGTMRFAERLIGTPTGIPDTNTIRIDADIIDGTGGFTGARGHVVFDGITNLAGGEGTFTGNWTLPRPRPTPHR